jgi:hypothetical protein
MNPLRDNPLNARLADGVRRVGFRKWYERELLSSHAHMVLAVLAVIGMLGSLEAMRGAPQGEQFLDLVLVLASGLIAFWALRRYLFLLMRAEVVANQASCEDCGEYGRFSIDDDRPPQTRVCCLKCRHKWVIDAGAN